MSRKHCGHSKYLHPISQEMTLHISITRWSTLKSDWLYSLKLKMEKLCRISKNKTWRWLWLRSWAPYCKIRFKLKKVEKTPRPFRYDLNQIPYDYSGGVTNRFKELDLTECLKNYGQRFITLYKRHWPKPLQRKRNARSQNGFLRRSYK